MSSHNLWHKNDEREIKAIKSFWQEMPDVKLLQSRAAYFAAVETRYLLTKKRFASVAMRGRGGGRTWGWGFEGTAQRVGLNRSNCTFAELLVIDSDCFWSLQVTG